MLGVKDKCILFQIVELDNGLSIEFIKEYNKIPWK